MNAMSVLEIEFLGVDEIQPMSRTVPALPLDDPLWLENVTGGKAAQRVADDAFIKEICGDPASPQQVFSESDDAEPLELLKRSAGPSRKRIINDRLDTKLYRHDRRERWNSMLEKFAAEGADALPDAVLFRKASAYLGVS